MNSVGHIDCVGAKGISFSTMREVFKKPINWQSYKHETIITFISFPTIISNKIKIISLKQNQKTS